MKQIIININPATQTVEVVAPQEDGTMDVLERITHDNLCYAVVLATDFIKEINRDYCVTCYKNEREWENTVGMCAKCWQAELQRQEDDFSQTR